MDFNEDNLGPFYLNDNHRKLRKHDRPSGKWKTITKTKKKLKIELKEKGYVVRGHMKKERIEQLAKEYEISRTCEEEVVKEGWLGKPKGLLQVLLERGWVDENRISEYSLKGTKTQVDKEGNIFPDHQRFVLHSLMIECADFKEEKSAMEVLLDGLSAKSSNNSLSSSWSPPSTTANSQVRELSTSGAWPNASTKAVP